MRVKNSKLFDMKVKKVMSEKASFKTKIFDRTRPDKMIELEYPHLKLFCSYKMPVALYDKQSKKYFRTDMDNKVVNHDIDKWLDGATATIQPQQFFSDLLNPERYSK